MSWDSEANERSRVLDTEQAPSNTHHISVLTLPQTQLVPERNKLVQLLNRLKLYVRPTWYAVVANRHYVGLEVAGGAGESKFEYGPLRHRHLAFLFAIALIGQLFGQVCKTSVCLIRTRIA